MNKKQEEIIDQIENILKTACKNISYWKYMGQNILILKKRNIWGHKILVLKENELQQLINLIMELTKC